VRPPRASSDRLAGSGTAEAKTPESEVVSTPEGVPSEMAAVQSVSIPSRLKEFIDKEIGIDAEGPVIVKRRRREPR
jgi:hypothetical protein